MENEQTLLKYRVDALETDLKTAIRDIGIKLDTLIALQQGHDKTLVLEVERREQLEKDVEKLDIKVDTLGEKIVKLQVGFAEKLGPGAAAGGLVSGALMLIQWLVGA